jgi:hypothetical protein
MTRDIPAGHVCVVVPNDSSVITTPDGEPHLVEIDPQGRRVVWISADHTRALLNSGLPCSLPWKEANMQLAANLGAQKVAPGINVGGRLQHAAWEATRPTSIVEDLARMRSAMRGGWR